MATGRAGREFIDVIFAVHVKTVTGVGVVVLVARAAGRRAGHGKAAADDFGIDGTTPAERPAGTRAVLG